MQTKTLALRLVPSVALGLSLLLEACAARNLTVNISAEDAAQTANRLLESRERGGVSPSRVELFSTSGNPCLTDDNPDPAYASRVGEVKRALVDRRYYLVMYEFPNVVFGSTICVFVDAKDGTLIEYGLF
jgi:hypothetical protein